MWRARRRTQRLASVAERANCHDPTPNRRRQLLADPGRVVGREHVGDAAPDLALDGGDRRGRPVAGHRTGVTEAEVDVVVAVDALEMGALGRLDIRREGPGPLDHPGHGHAFEERPTSTRVKRRGTWMLLGEAGHLARHQAGEAVAIEAGVVRHGPSMAGLSGCRAAIPPRATRPVQWTRRPLSGRGGRSRRYGRSPARCRGRHRGSWDSRWCRRRGGWMRWRHGCGDACAASRKLVR